MPQYDTIPTVEDAREAVKHPVWSRKELIAEVIGTCILTQVGCAGLCVTVYMGAMSGLWQAAVVWLLGATLAIYATAAISGGHLNPAVTLAFALVRSGDFSLAKVIPYWIAQLIGGIIAGLINLSLFHSAIASFEESEGIDRGAYDGVASAVAFGDYYMLNGDAVRSSIQALFIEAFGTGFLAFVIFIATHPSNSAVSPNAVPLLVGSAIGTMIALFGSLTGAGINPARDFGPRLVTLFFGWGVASMRGFWVYIVGPLIGAPLGAALVDLVLYAD